MVFCMAGGLGHPALIISAFRMPPGNREHSLDCHVAPKSKPKRHGINKNVSTIAGVGTAFCVPPQEHWNQSFVENGSEHNGYRAGGASYA
jgi:hypothetical protein